MEKIKKLYFHILNGQPARYFKGEQICYASNRGLNLSHGVKSLKRIEEEVELSKDYRKKKGFSLFNDYDHFIININR